MHSRRNVATLPPWLAVADLALNPSTRDGREGGTSLRLTVLVHLALLVSHNAWRYHCMVIRSFRDSDTERLFNREAVRRYGADIQRVALRRMRQLDAAMVLDDLRVPPGNRLEKLRGEREGQFSIRINDQWRICFRWSGGDAYDVEIVDYH